MTELGERIFYMDLKSSVERITNSEKKGERWSERIAVLEGSYHRMGKERKRGRERREIRIAYRAQVWFGPNPRTVTEADKREESQ